MSMITIELHGHLGEKFGRTHRYDIASVGEAIRALKANHKGFEQYMLEHNIPGYYIYAGNSKLIRHKEVFNLRTSSTIRIVPVVGGSSSKDVLDIFIGAAIIWFAPQLAAGLTEYYTTAVVLTTIFRAIGYSLLTKGVGNLLFKPPGIQTPNQPENMPSYAFNGPVNTIQQGNPVPICYGRLRVGSQIISAGLSVEQLI